MGVSASLCVVYGVKLPYEHPLKEAYTNKINNEWGSSYPIEFVVDYMTGKYIVVGKIFSYDNTSDGNILEVPSEEMLIIEKAEYMQKFLKHFPQFATVMDEQFKVLVFNHFS